MNGLSCKFLTLFSIGLNWSTINCKFSSRYQHHTSGPGRSLTFPPPVPPDRSGPLWTTKVSPRVTLRFSVSHCLASSEGPLWKVTMHTDPAISSLDWGLTTLTMLAMLVMSSLQPEDQSQKHLLPFDRWLSLQSKLRVEGQNIKGLK